MFKVKQRYQINNQHSVNNGKFLTIYYFNIHSDFVYDMISIH